MFGCMRYRMAPAPMPSSLQAGPSTHPPSTLWALPPGAPHLPLIWGGAWGAGKRLCIVIL
jgi:hypothetical protein